MSIILDEAQPTKFTRLRLLPDHRRRLHGRRRSLRSLLRWKKVPVTDVEIEAAAKYLKANPGLFGPSACFIDPNRFEEIARSVLQAARNAVGKDME